MLEHNALHDKFTFFDATARVKAATHLDLCREDTTHLPHPRLQLHKEWQILRPPHLWKPSSGGEPCTIQYANTTCQAPHCAAADEKNGTPPSGLQPIPWRLVCTGSANCGQRLSSACTAALRTRNTCRTERSTVMSAPACCQRHAVRPQPHHGPSAAAQVCLVRRAGLQQCNPSRWRRRPPRGASQI